MANTTFSGPVISNNGFITGTASSPITETTAGNVSESYVTTSAATGDTRLSYQRLAFTSTGSGETYRALTQVTGAGAATGGTVNGAHISLSINGSGTISGAGNALRATLGGTSTNPGGTIAAIQLDSNFGAGVTLPATSSFMRVTDSGTVKVGSLFNLPAPASDTIFRAKAAAAVTHVIKIVAANGTPYYVMVSDAV
jgi:hypothetical protein